MSSLTVWKFETWNAANEAIATLEGLAKQGVITVHDAATVTWPPDARKPKTRQLHHLARRGALGGMFWGMLFGMIFLMPFVGAAVGAASGAVAGKLRDAGIDDDFIKEAREKITPGTSALFLLSSDAVLDKVQATFEATGLSKPQLIKSNLTDEQEANLREMFGS